MGAPSFPVRILNVVRKNGWWKLTAGFLAAIIVLGAAVEAAQKIWDTKKLFSQAKTDTDAISALRRDLEKQKDSLEILLRDSNGAYREIAAVRVIAIQAKDQIGVLGNLVSEAKSELAVLKQRNQITALADAAISQGSVEAYIKLEDMVTKARLSDTRGPEEAELFRVFNAYTGFAPSRVGTVTLNAKVINSTKDKEEELTTEDMIPFLLTNRDFLTRGRCAKLISSVGKQWSYKTAETLIGAMKHESHLEVHRYLKAAFKHIVPDCKLEGPLDNSGIIKWWEENKENVRAKDSDKPTEPPK